MSIKIFNQTLLTNLLKKTSEKIILINKYIFKIIQLIIFKLVSNINKTNSPDKINTKLKCKKNIDCLIII
jgi:hypothetical protein